MSARLTGTPLERVLARVLLDGDCLIWQGAVDRHGYGYVSGGKRGVMRPVHQVTYEELVGPVPEGLELDHLCEHPSCCAPWHLEPVTHGENLRRRRRDGRCPYGHPYDSKLDSRGHRRCLTCAVASNLRGRQKVKV